MKALKLLGCRGTLVIKLKDYVENYYINYVLFVDYLLPKI